MKHFDDETNAVDAVAHEAIEVAARVVQRVRVWVRDGQTTGLTFTQVRALGFVSRWPGASLGDAADFLGLGAPTTSKVVDELTQRGLVRRAPAADDRRRLELRVTEEGARVLAEARAPADARMAALLATLGEGEVEAIRRALELLAPLLDPREGRDE
ncbi:MAG TPA: MarR family transcriptional regulator [Longimicrobium sp.]|nr:MarR family transcriptional regulator [Longimicrobium sp.]